MRIQQRRFSRAVLALQHDERVRKIHHHRHMEVEDGENGVRQDLQKHRQVRIAEAFSLTNLLRFGCGAGRYIRGKLSDLKS